MRVLMNGSRPSAWTHSAGPATATLAISLLAVARVHPVHRRYTDTRRRRAPFADSRSPTIPSWMPQRMMHLCPVQLLEYVCRTSPHLIVRHTPEVISEQSTKMPRRHNGVGQRLAHNSGLQRRPPAVPQLRTSAFEERRSDMHTLRSPALCPQVPLPQRSPRQWVLLQLKQCPRRL